MHIRSGAMEGFSIASLGLGIQILPIVGQEQGYGLKELAAQRVPLRGKGGMSLGLDPNNYKAVDSLDKLNVQLETNSRKKHV